MQIQTETIIGTKASEVTTGVGAPTLVTDYGSIADAIAAAKVAGTSGECVVDYISLGFTPGAIRPYRQVLTAYIDGSGDFAESIYLVLQGAAEGSVSIVKACDLLWTAGSVAASNIDADLDYPASVVTSNDGLLAAIAGSEIRTHDDAGFALAVIEDIGPAVGIIRAGYLPGSGAADGGALGSISWR